MQNVFKTSCALLKYFQQRFWKRLARERAAGGECECERFAPGFVAGGGGLEAFGGDARGRSGSLCHAALLIALRDTIGQRYFGFDEEGFGASTWA